MKARTKKIAIIGMAAAAAMLLSYVESFFYLGIPGMKVGLPNVFIVCIMYLYGVWNAATVSVVRCVLTAVLFGSIMSFWYSIAGAIISLAVMWIIKRTEKLSVVGVSVVGGITHNAAQIAVAVAVTGVEQIAYYLPILILSGTVAGAVIGIAAAIVEKRVEKII